MANEATPPRRRHTRSTRRTWKTADLRIYGTASSSVSTMLSTHFVPRLVPALVREGGFLKFVADTAVATL